MFKYNLVYIDDLDTLVYSRYRFLALCDRDDS